MQILREKLLNVRNEMRSGLIDKMPAMFQLPRDSARDSEHEGKVSVSDRNKREAFLADLDGKDKFLNELLMEKEELDKGLVSYAQLHYVHKTFKQVKTALKLDGKRFKRDKHNLKAILDNITGIFLDNSM